MQQIDVHAESRAGYRNDNQDDFRLALHPQDHNIRLLSLADGQGGQPGGALAARLAVDNAVAEASHHAVSELCKPDTWSDVMEWSDLTISKHPDAGLTTLTAIAADQEWLCGASSGDSLLIWVNSEGSCRILSKMQPKNPPMGSGHAAYAHFSVSCLTPWRLVAMTDGVWKALGEERIMQIVTAWRGPDLVRFLLDQAQAADGGILRDDATALLLQISSTHDM